MSACTPDQLNAPAVRRKRPRSEPGSITTCAADTAQIGLPEAKRGMGANFGAHLLSRIGPGQFR